MLEKIIPHLCIIFSLVILTFLVLQQYNPSMFGKPFFQGMLLLQCVATFVAAAFLIAYRRKS